MKIVICVNAAWNVWNFRKPLVEALVADGPRMLEDQPAFDRVADDFQPDVIVHLAAQAGVRYSLENPRAYLDANVIGTSDRLVSANPDTSRGGPIQ